MTLKKKAMHLWMMKNDETAEIRLYGDIGANEFDGISAKEIVTQIENTNTNKLNLYINTNGGVVTEALAIANALKRYKGKTIAYIDGIVASAGTIITSACDIVKMPKNALYMVHAPWTLACGNKKDLQDAVDTLEKMENCIVQTYLEKTNLSENKIRDFINKETWFEAEEAKEYGFVNEIIENVKMEKVKNGIKANGIVFNMSSFKNFKEKIENKEDIMNEKLEKEEIIITRELLMSKYPDVYDEILEEGMVKERARLKELEELNIDSEIITQAKFTTLKTANQIGLDLAKELIEKSKNLNVENKINTEEKKEVVNITKTDYRDENKPIVNVVNTGYMNESKAKFLDTDVDLIFKAMKGGM